MVLGNRLRATISFKGRVSPKTRKADSKRDEWRMDFTR
jgi:hypothetical protein